MTQQTLRASSPSSSLRGSSPRFNPRPAPITTVQPTEHKQRIATRERLDCPRCGKVYMGAAIVTSEPERVTNFLRVNYTGWLVVRRFYCDHDNMVIGWHQAIDKDSGKLKEEIGEFWLIKDPRKVAKFLTDHPEAAGVSQ